MVVVKTDLWSLRNAFEKAYELMDGEIPLIFKQGKLLINFVEPSHVVYTSMELKTKGRVRKEVKMMLEAEPICDVLKKIPTRRSKNKDDPEKFVSIEIAEGLIKFVHPKITISKAYIPEENVDNERAFKPISNDLLNELLDHKIVAPVNTKQLQLFIKITNKLSKTFYPAIKLIYDSEKLVAKYGDELEKIESVLANGSDIVVKGLTAPIYKLNISPIYLSCVIKKIKCPSIKLGISNPTGAGCGSSLTVKWMENEWLKGYSIIAGMREEEE